MNGKIQYTIRNIPKDVDETLRKFAVREGCSLNAVALGALKTEAGVSDSKPGRYHDLDYLAGTWVQDDECDKAMELFNVVDEELWK